MTNRPLRVLLVSSHPVQYATPIFRLLAKDPRVKIQVAYCSLQGAEPEIDPDFGVEVKWDIPLLEGYSWQCLPNRFAKPDLGSFWGLCNTAIWKLIRRGRFDAVVLYTGYVYATFWIGVVAAKTSGAGVLFGTDSTGFRPRDGKWWKIPIKRVLLPFVFRLADVIPMPSEASCRFALDMGIPESRVILAPFAVDNAWWLQRAAEVDRPAVRRAWNIPDDAMVAVFCAKLQPWKRPQDALRAFAKAKAKNSYLVMAGNGPMRTELEAEAKSLGIADRVRFLGFVNQTGLPPVYRASDVFIMASEYDPCPVVVCEAMLCGCPVILSDQVIGRFDLVQHGLTGFRYPCGDTDALATILSDASEKRDRLAEMSSAAMKRMETWSPHDYVEGIVRAVRVATGE